MEIFENFKELFLSVWNKGIIGVDFVQILIGLGIFFIFLVFRGLISKLIIRKLEIISKRTTNKLDDTFVKAMDGPADLAIFPPPPGLISTLCMSIPTGISDNGKQFPTLISEFGPFEILSPTLISWGAK